MKKIIVVLALIAIVVSGIALGKTVGAPSSQSSQPQKAVDLPVHPTDQGCGPAGSAGPVCPWTGGGSGGTGVHGVVLM